MSEVKYKNEYRRQIAEMALAGKSTSEIAKHFEVEPGTISHLLWQMKRSGEIPRDFDGRSNRPVRKPRTVFKYPPRKKPKENDLSEKAIGLTEKKCPVCGKIFYKSGAEWGYKIGEADLCTYSCMRVAEKQVKVKKKRNRRVG